MLRGLRALRRGMDMCGQFIDQTGKPGMVLLLPKAVKFCYMCDEEMNRDEANQKNRK